MQAGTSSLSSVALRGSRSTTGGGLPLPPAIGALWRFIQAFGQRPAAAEILALANTLQATRPATAAQMRRAAGRSWY